MKGYFVLQIMILCRCCRRNFPRLILSISHVFIWLRFGRLGSSRCIVAQTVFYLACGLTSLK